jgi:multidrug efflux pump subunit AcrA (membrane-fusion protein)
MKKNLIIAGIVIVVTIIIMVAFNGMTTRGNDTVQFTQVQQGKFEVTVVGTGELLAERSVDILAPAVMAGGRGGGGDIRVAPMKIQDLIPEGTMVKKGDFIAQLDRTDYDNNLKDDRDRLSTLMTQLEMKNLDSAVSLTALRDGIRNQKFTVSEAEITYRNSRYESPEIIRQAEIAFDKAKRMLEQLNRSYKLKTAQSIQDIRNTEFFIGRVTNRITSTENLLKQFTIISPSDGMLIYKRDFRGSKRKIGTMIAPFDRIVANIPDLSSMISRTFISEIDVNKVKTGQKADINIDAFPLRSYKGTIISIANIGEELPNSDSKVFETQIRIDGTDPDLRPSMTTGNKIMISSVENVIYISTECIQSGTDTLTFVYTRNRKKQIVMTGISNEKYTVIEKGLKPGTVVYLSEPQDHDKFKLAGKELIPALRQKYRMKADLAERR